MYGQTFLESVEQFVFRQDMKSGYWPKPESASQVWVRVLGFFGVFRGFSVGFAEKVCVVRRGLCEYYLDIFGHPIPAQPMGE